MREMDRAAIQQYGISEEILMENAGQGAYAVLCREIGVRGEKFVVLCIPGNNGSDGFVVARKIYSSARRKPFSSRTRVKCSGLRVKLS